jgi:hypothetical protein
MMTPETAAIVETSGILFPPARLCGSVERFRESDELIRPSAA